MDWVEFSLNALRAAVSDRVHRARRTRNGTYTDDPDEARLVLRRAPPLARRLHRMSNLNCETVCFLLPDDTACNQNKFGRMIKTGRSRPYTILRITSYTHKT